MIYHNTLRSTAMLACALSLTACIGGQRGAEAVVRESLKDPDSARFGAFYYNGKTKNACLTVNARNSMGGYTGDEPATLRHDDKGWHVISLQKISAEDCKTIHADDPS